MIFAFQDEVRLILGVVEAAHRLEVGILAVWILVFCLVYDYTREAGLICVAVQQIRNYVQSTLRYIEGRVNRFAYVCLEVYWASLPGVLNVLQVVEVAQLEFLQLLQEIRPLQLVIAVDYCNLVWRMSFLGFAQSRYLVAVITVR